jgi:hypothetical protein
MIPGKYPGPAYCRARDALSAAHEACFGHPLRDGIGMSHGSFAGVNVALGEIRNLEIENERLRRKLAKAEARSE